MIPDIDYAIELFVRRFNGEISEEIIPFVFKLVKFGVNVFLV